MKKNRAISYSSLLLVLSFFLLGSCSKGIQATSTSGRVLDVYKNTYAEIYLETNPGKADWGGFFNVYMPEGVRKDDRIKIVTERYLDSLIQATRRKPVKGD